MLTGLTSNQWHRCLQRAAFERISVTGEGWHPSGGRNFYPHCSRPLFLRARESCSQVRRVNSVDVQPLESGQNEVFCPPFTSLLLGSAETLVAASEAASKSQRTPTAVPDYLLSLPKQPVGERWVQRDSH
ncbi:hypothetical protein HJG60_008277 [Phyllostomus discolor]|uniref:Uncharacterized protein n=1 Tax=Phyllostomus discolor TaxID=89673 RepID=A0A833Z442_9CHIR|nr:hypothetical protein HJG60_008277 [Phyllostomus discolor]